MRVLVLLLAMLVNQQLFAWGATGHRIVGEIAEDFLTTRAALRAHQILNGQSLARVSNWADEIRSDPDNYSHTYNWHYTTWPHDHDHPMETHDRGLLLTAIQDQLSIIANPELNDEQKHEALKFVVHLVGDLHQPFHVGSSLTDRGANACRVVYFGERINLHQLWDSGMVDFTRLSFTEYKNFLLQDLTRELFQRTISGNLYDWARESRDLTFNAYPAEVDGTTGTFGQESYCSPVVTNETSPQLGYQYNFQHMDTVNRRLLEGGIRLAVLLNAVLQ